MRCNLVRDENDRIYCPVCGKDYVLSEIEIKYWKGNLKKSHRECFNWADPEPKPKTVDAKQLVQKVGCNKCGKKQALIREKAQRNLQPPE